MRLLHTSDWHLGRSLHRASLAEAQAAFVDQLVEVVTSERVDVVCVSGDVYDRAVPPLEAVQLCEEAFTRLRAAGARVVVISGNHDSARRLGFGSRLIDASGVHLRTSFETVDQPVVVEGVSFFPVPYLEPAAVGERSHEAAVGAALQRVRQVAPPGSVVLAHCWASGGIACDSERDITVGGVSAVPLELFDGFAYAALGHLHGAQVLSDTVRYSGSPLAYSFSEARHTKGSWLVDLAAGTTDFVPAPVPRRLSTLTGRLEELLVLDTDVEQDWLSVTLTDAARPESALERLSARFPHVLVLTFAPEGAAPREGSYASRVAGRTDLEVATGFVRHVRGTDASDGETALLDEAFSAVRESCA